MIQATMFYDPDTGELVALIPSEDGGNPIRVDARSSVALAAEVDRIKVEADEPAEQPPRSR